MQFSTPGSRCAAPYPVTRVIYTLFFLLLLATACTRRESIPEESEANPAEKVEVYDGKLVAQVIFDSVDYIIPKQELMQPFIREFGDGTVVDRVTIRKVQETKEDEPAYYLVGIGIQNGSFRSMALELDVAADNSLFLSSQGSKHMCQAAAGCGFCYFTFLGNKITGCECASNVPGNNCVHKVSDRNGLLKGIQVRDSR